MNSNRYGDEVAYGLEMADELQKKEKVLSKGSCLVYCYMGGWELQS